MEILCSTYQPIIAGWGQERKPAGFLLTGPEKGFITFVLGNSLYFAITCLKFPVPQPPPGVVPLKIRNKSKKPSLQHFHFCQLHKCFGVMMGKAADILCHFVGIYTASCTECKKGPAGSDPLVQHPVYNCGQPDICLQDSSSRGTRQQLFHCCPSASGIKW